MPRRRRSRCAAREVFAHADRRARHVRHRARARHARGHPPAEGGDGGVRRPASRSPSTSKLLREVKALADVLGERRDPDVAIAALERVAAGAHRRRPAGHREPRRRDARGPGAGQRAAWPRRSSSMSESRLEERLLALAQRGPPPGAVDHRRSTAGCRHEGPQGEGPGPRWPAGRQRTPDRGGAPRRAALLRAPGARVRRAGDAARHADRGQAPAVRARAVRAGLRSRRRRRRQGGQEAAGPARARSTTATRCSRACGPTPMRLRAQDAAAVRESAGRRSATSTRPPRARRPTAPATAAWRAWAPTSPRAGRCCSSASWSDGRSWRRAASPRTLLDGISPPEPAPAARADGAAA